MITVVWLMGNSFCGSTMVCMMMSGHPDIMGVGELHHLYRASPQNIELPPTSMRDGHRVMWCNKCKDFGYNPMNCSLARHAYKYEDMIDWYDEIAKFLDTNILVDSSKVELWWNPLIERGVLDRYDIRPLIMWKDPVRNVHSFYRKGAKGDLDKAINSYYRINNVLDICEDNFDHVNVVQYKHITERPEEVLKQTCNSVGVPFKSGSSNYWNNEHHCIGGNVGARSHLFGDYRQFQRQIHPIYMEKHQQIFVDKRYLDVFDEDKIDYILSDEKVTSTCKKLSELSGIDYTELLIP
jgi:hypothetical protein